MMQTKYGCVEYDKFDQSCQVGVGHEPSGGKLVCFPNRKEPDSGLRENLLDALHSFTAGPSLCKPMP